MHVHCNHKKQSMTSRVKLIEVAIAKFLPYFYLTMCDVFQSSTVSPVPSLMS